MKRLSTALAPTLMTGALLGIGVASQAQTNVLGFLGDIPEFVTKGSQFSIVATVTQANPEHKTTAIQSTFRFDPATVTVTRQNIDIPNVTESFIANGTRRTVSVTGGQFAGPNVVLGTSIGIFDEESGAGGFTIPAGTHFIRYNITVLSTAGLGGFTEFGFSDALWVGSTFAGNAQSVITTSPSQNPAIRTSFTGGNNPSEPGGFRVGIVPGPSSLAVFALGGLAPAMALIRRRRAAK